MMIFDGETKDAPPHNQRSHSFPLLKDSASNDKENSSPGRNECFKPLFANTCKSGSLSPHKGLHLSSTCNDQKSEDGVRRKNFERGFNAGSQDACSLVQEQMAPQIKSFADAFSHWNEIMLQVEEKSNLQILKMAVTIAEKILGSPPKCCTKGLDALETELKERMRKTYQLSFKMNPEDMNALSGLTACENVPWGQWDYIAVTGAPEVPRGSLSVEPGTRVLLADDGILRSLDTSLSDASTK